MTSAKILVIGGGIGGLTAAIALCRRGFTVHLIERHPAFTVYGVGIIQQANVIRAVATLGILDAYIDAGFGFDHVSVFAPNGARVARLTTPRLLEEYPSNVGISRRALHQVLVDTARAAGTVIHLGATADRLEDTGTAVKASFSSGTSETYDLVIGADGLHSSTREMIFPDAAPPEFTGQGVWRYNLKRVAEVDGIHAYHGKIGVGLCPLAQDVMYMFATTPEPENTEYPRVGLAKIMRDKLTDCPPAILKFAAAITEDEAVVYRPLEWLFLTGAWHRGRIVLLGDAVHATTPHLGQGAGLAIEDSLVLADELSKAASPEQAFQAYRDRRYERCRYIVEKSKSICYSQLGKGPYVDQAEATQEMFGVIAHPI